MIEEYQCRPPLKYFILGISSLAASIIFALPIGRTSIWFSIVSAFFCLLTLLMSISFLTIFIRKFNAGKLIIGSDHIEIPGRWKKRQRIKYIDIYSVYQRYEMYDQIIEIDSKPGFYIIEKNWMKKNEFEEAKRVFKEYCQLNNILNVDLEPSL